MSDASPIEWTDSTWNPVRGCSRVSAGCMNCYAERVAMRQSNPGGAYEGLVHQTSQGPKWTGKIRTVPRLLDQPLRWKKPRRIFVNSMSDLFHEDVPDDFIDQVFAMMALSPQHAFQLLTKRPERMLSYMTHDAGFGRWGFIDGWARRFYEGQHNKPFPAGKILIGPLPHVWLGVSVEDQAAADERIPLLLQTPAAVRWISAEPWLGPVKLKHGDLRPWEKPEQRPKLHWVVAGGESGPKARPSHPDWYRALRDQCRTTGVPFFFKQWGQWSPDYAFTRVATVDPVTGVAQNPNAAMGAKGLAVQGLNTMFSVGKTKAGRLLDGREWNEYPA